MTRNPVLHTDSGDVRLDPLSVSLDLELEPLSSAELEMKPGDTIPERSWVSVYTEHGLAGVFRSKPQQDRYGGRSSRVSLVHGAVEMNDYLTGKSEQAQASAASAIAAIFRFYGGTKWALGTVSPTASVVYELSGSGVLDAITEIMEQLPGYMISFDQTVTPWTISIVPRPTEVSAEGRLSRNVSSVEISRDDSSLCTRVYYGDSGSYVQDSDAVQRYGVIEHKISDSGLTAEQLTAIAQAYLDNHKRPKLSVSISAIDLYAATGETLDRIMLGSKYRLAIPDADSEENRLIEAVICSIRYDNVFSGNPQIVLASEPESIITFLKKQRRAGGAARQVAKDEAEKQYQHWVTENDHYKESVYKILGVQFDEHYNPVYQTDPDTGEIIVDEAGNPIPVFTPESDGSISSQVIESAQLLSQKVTYTYLNTTLGSYMTQTAWESKMGNYLETTKDGKVMKSIAQVVTMINDQKEGIVNITGDRVNIDASKSASVGNVLYITEGGSFWIKRNATFGNKAGEFVTINGGTVNAPILQVNSGGSLKFSPGSQSGTAISINHATAASLITDVHIKGPTESDNNYTLEYKKIGTSDTWNPTTVKIPAKIGLMDATVSEDGLTLTLTKSDGTTVNFNKAASSPTTLSGIWSGGRFTATASPADITFWTEITQGAPTWEGSQVTIPIKATDQDHPNYTYDTGRNVVLDVSSHTGSITNLSGTSIGENHILETIPITASGTNLNPYSESVSLAEATYQVGSFTRNCVTLSIDSNVIGRISTQDVYEYGQQSVTPSITADGWAWLQDQSGDYLASQVIVKNPYVTGDPGTTVEIVPPSINLGLKSNQIVATVSDGVKTGNVATASYAVTLPEKAVPSGKTAVELDPGKTYAIHIESGSDNYDLSYYSVPAQTTVVPKVSRGTWENGQLKFTAGTSGKSEDTVKILSGTQIGTLNENESLITFKIYEQTGADSELDTGATISAAIEKGTATPATPVWQGDSTHKYNVNATGTFKVGGKTVTQNTGSISGGFEPTDAIEYGKKLAKGIKSLTVSMTNQTEYAAATTIPEDTITGNGYYFVTATPNVGDPVRRKFHAPASGGGSDRWARYTEDIVLGADDTGESTWMKFATYNTGTTETDTAKKTSINVDASAVYDTGYRTGYTDAGGGVVNVTQTAWNYGRTTFNPSAGTGSSITIDIDPVYTLPGVSSANAFAYFTLKDVVNNQLIYPEKNFRLYLSSSGGYAYLKSDNYRPTNSNVMAKISIDSSPAEEPRNVSTISPIKLTPSDISSSTWYPTITYDDTDHTITDSVPLQIDASDVYSKGVADGSRLNLETLRVYPNTLTQNTTYTLYPSSGKQYMAGIQFTVDVPTVYRNAENLAEVITLPETHKGTATVYGTVEYDEGPNSTRFPVVINASKVYQQGVSDGAGYKVMGTKSYGTVRTSGSYTINPDDGFDAMESATFYVDVPRIQESVSETIYAPGTTTITPTNQYGAMKKAVVTVPQITVTTEADAYAGTNPVTSIRIGHNQKVTVKFGTTTMRTLFFKAVN